MRLADELLRGYEDDLEALTLVPGEGGVFDVAVDGKVVFSKERANRFPEPGEVTL